MAIFEGLRAVRQQRAVLLVALHTYSNTQHAALAGHKEETKGNKTHQREKRTSGKFLSYACTACVMLKVGNFS